MEACFLFYLEEYNVFLGADISVWFRNKRVYVSKNRAMEFKVWLAGEG